MFTIFHKNMTAQKHKRTSPMTNLQSVNTVMHCFPANNNTFVCPGNEDGGFSGTTMNQDNGHQTLHTNTVFSLLPTFFFLREELCHRILLLY